MGRCEQVVLWIREHEVQWTLQVFEHIVQVVVDHLETIADEQLPWVCNPEVCAANNPAVVLTAT